MPQAAARKSQRAGRIVFPCVYPQSDLCSHTRTRSTQVSDLSADDMSANFDNLHKIINESNSLEYHNLIVKIIVRFYFIIKEQI